MIKLFESAQDFLNARNSAKSIDPRIVSRVSRIIEEVRAHGDTAVKRFTEAYDGVQLSQPGVPISEINHAESQLSADIRNLLEEAIQKVRFFHEHQMPESWLKELKGGGQLGMQYRPIEAIGVYIPGGTAGYPSTVIMTVVPALIAGVKRIALASPPGKDGSVNPLVLAAASYLGVTEVYSIGGAQAVAALAYGTESIQRVHKIVGPGNAYVNEAKRQVFGMVGIDALAGPTEVVILADETANPDYIIRDMFAQAEHDPVSRTVLVTRSEKVATAVQARSESLLKDAERFEILKEAVGNHSAAVLVPNLDEGVKLVNELAPEHLQIMTRSPHSVLEKITNAGAIFLGDFTPAVTGDYFAGPNHVLPTAGTAKFTSPLSVLDFMKFSSVVSYSKENLRRDSKLMSRFAELEGLLNHKIAIECRHE